MEKLFCFPVFCRKSKVKKSLTSTDLKKDPKKLDIVLAKKDAASNVPSFVKEIIVACDINSPASKEGMFVKEAVAEEGRSPVMESLLCKPHKWTDEQLSMSNLQSSCVSEGHQDVPPNETSVHAKWAPSYEMDSQERSTPHSPQLGCGSYGGYKSDSDAVGSEVTRQSCTDSSSHPRKGSASPGAGAEGTERGIFDGMDLFEGQEEARRDAIFRYSPDKAISSIKNVGWDDVMLGCHASDPGVYRGEEIQSLNGFSVLQDDGSVVPSLLLEESQNLDSHSRVSGDAAENLSVETCGHCSEPTFHVVEVIDPRPDNVSVGNLSVSLAARLNQESSNLYPVYEGNFEQQPKNLLKLKGKMDDVEEVEGIFTIALGPQSLNAHDSAHESSLSRVKEWISSIQQADLTVHNSPSSEIIEEVAEAPGGLPGAAIMDRELSSAAVRSLSVYATVAHVAGIGLREVPSLGVFSCLKTLNLSANSITRVLAGYLPQSLQNLDISRNRISQIEGFRELTRLRVLNLSHNRISRIGHGLGNCTVIKELYMAGNKIAEVDGLHRLLKLGVLDLSHNKIATSKALGQLAANYSSLLALNLQGNPVLVNVGEDQLRKVVCSLAPHVAYLNKQPIKAVSVREAVVDNVARAALGTSHRNNKSSTNRVSRKVAGVQSSASTQKKLPSRRVREAEKRQGFISGRASKQQHSHNHHGHHSRDSSSVQFNEKAVSKELGYSSGTPLLEQRAHNLSFNSWSQSMHRSRSEGTLHEVQ